MTTLKSWLSRRWVLLLLLLVTWIVVATVLKGRDTLELSTMENTPVTQWLNDGIDAIRANRQSNPLFVYVFNPIRMVVEFFIEAIRALISLPQGSNVIPIVGWLGSLAIVGYIVYATSTLRTSLLAMSLLLGCGMLGMWAFTMDTLSMTMGAVILSLLIGLPLGIWAGINDRVNNAMRPLLDLAQILPTLVYLAPLVLVFLIGVAAATIATMIYSIPICIRITAHAIRTLRAGPIEAAESMGSTKLQVLSKVQLPMAKRTIILGVNQTTMAALSFVVIAALIGAPGLGSPVVDALMIRNVGKGFTAGMAVVLLAIMLDRATTAAVIKSESIDDSPETALRRRIGLIVGGVLTIVAIVMSRYVLWAAVYPDSLDFEKQIASFADTVVGWFTSTFDFFTEGFNIWFTTTLLNPLESLLAQTPWYVTIIAISLLAVIIGGRVAAAISVVLLTLIVIIGLWNDTMVTLAQVLMATAVTMIIGVVLGVMAGRSPRMERILKPILDAGQTLPAFVYLVPVLALFGPTRFAAIVCGIFYAAPVVVRIVADGVRGVPKEMVEAATSAGSTRTQVITKVQLPASKRSVLLSANQGLIFVLAVIVIGAYVGAGGLGYLVIAGLSKPELQGKGLAAGLAIVLLGVVMDRIAHASANRSGPSGH